MLLTELPLKYTAILESAPQLRFQEFADRDILRQTFTSSRLEHEVSRNSLRTSHLQWSKLDFAVEGVTGYNAPFIKDQTQSCLTLSVDTEISLEAEGVDDGDETADRVERCACYGSVGEHVASSSG